jgi:hypothetical protein
MTDSNDKSSARQQLWVCQTLASAGQRTCRTACPHLHEPEVRPPDVSSPEEYGPDRSLQCQRTAVPATSPEQVHERCQEFHFRPGRHGVTRSVHAGQETAWLLAVLVRSVGQPNPNFARGRRSCPPPPTVHRQLDALISMRRQRHDWVELRVARPSARTRSQSRHMRSLADVSAAAPPYVRVAPAPPRDRSIVSTSSRPIKPTRRGKSKAQLRDF